MTNMRSRLLGLLFVSVGLAVSAGCGPGTAPAAQPPMVTMNAQAIEDIRAEFNRSAGQARVILLLSPT
jgi:hypothetical protein